MTSACPKCSQDLARTDRVVLVGEMEWHEGCALAHVVESLAMLTKSTPALLTPEDAAEQLRVAVDTVHRLAREGALGYVLITRPGAADDKARRRFRQSHIDEYLSAREHFARPEVVQAEVSPRPLRAKPLSVVQEQHRSLQPRSRRRTGQR